MSSQKEKLLNSAQKFILKGQLDRAIKDYEQVIALDPGDVRQRQKFAELLVKGNRKEEALKQYETIGKYYADNGFYLKAIAVCKQSQKLDPRNIDLTLLIASLNEKQGLIGNALAEYKTVVDHYEKSGLPGEAVKILEKMLALDPDNLNVQLKMAETHFARGLAEESYQEFTRVAIALKERREEGLFDRVCSRVRELFPGRGEFILDMLAAQIKTGDAAGAITKIRQQLSHDGADLKLLALLAEAYQATGDTGSRKSTCRRILTLSPDDRSAKAGLIECAIEEGDAENALSLLRLHARDFMAGGSSSDLEGLYIRLQTLLPDDPRVLEGLKEVYEATGDKGKLADILARLKTLLPGEEEHRQEEPAEEPVPPVDAVVAREERPAEEFQWEEEIDLSFPEDPAGPDPEREMPGEVPTEHLIPLETLAEELPIEIELEIEEPPLVHPEELAESDIERELEEAGLLPEKPSDEGRASAGGSGKKPGKDKYGLDGVFSEFKKGIGRQLDEEDTETHYNLGIAYKEMGLLDDAIAEFRVAARDPQREVDCLTLLGICHREKGEFKAAEELLLRGLAGKGRAPEEVLSLKYELALLYEAEGRGEDALKAFREVADINPSFRETGKKAAGLLGLLDDEEELELVETELEEVE